MLFLAEKIIQCILHRSGSASIQHGAAAQIVRISMNLSKMTVSEGILVYNPFKTLRLPTKHLTLGSGDPF